MILSKSKKLLATGASKCDNERTTYKAVQPNRHTLAIFMPTHSTGVNASLLSTENVLTVYGGLIVQNTIPFLGNMHSRLCTVVETRNPYRLHSLTKYKGLTMKNLSIERLYSVTHTLLINILSYLALLAIGLLFIAFFWLFLVCILSLGA